MTGTMVGWTSPTPPERPPFDLSVLVVQYYSVPRSKDWVTAARYFDPRTGRQIEGIGLVLESGFSEGLAAATDKPGGLTGFVNRGGEVVIAHQFISASEFVDGLSVVQLKDRSNGLLNRDGKWVVRPGTYEELGPVSAGCCAFRKDGRWGFLDGLGNVVVPAKYLQPGKSSPHSGPEFSFGLAVVRTEAGEFVYIDRSGTIRVRAPKDAEFAGPFMDGLACIRHADGKYGFITCSGNEVVGAEYSCAGGFREGLAPVSRNTTAGYHENENPSNAFLAWGNDKADRWGYIDVAGKTAIEFRFNRAGRFSEGLARVVEGGPALRGGKWGYVDQTGRYVIPPKYDWAYDFKAGVAEVWKDGKILYIDRTGKVLIDTGIRPEF